MTKTKITNWERAGFVLLVGAMIMGALIVDKLARPHEYSKCMIVETDKGQCSQILQ